MDFRKISLALPLVCATAGMIGCGSDDHDRTLTVSETGLAVDGYLQYATVCIDTDDDKSCDGETAVQTDADGAFTVTGSVSSLDYVILVQSDADTEESATQGGVGVPVTDAITLTALPGTEIVSPFSTIVQVGVEQGIYAAEAVAEIAVKGVLGLGADVDLGSYDFIEDNNANVIAVAEAVTDALVEYTTGIADNTSLDATDDAEIVFESAVVLLITGGDSSAGAEDGSSTSFGDIAEDPEVSVEAVLIDVIDVVEEVIATNSEDEGDAIVTGVTGSTGG